ncbi:serine/threonine-protein kinase 17A [Achlya hypogyna]|uniref:Serine/threonine-protein kinase 17A n=1 Tax=Achlya hypogyna TaxID=1202772 RepID=A0A1V9YJU3_ACHHY|nr:serine/threonine-protein kinase 17A [Achlya hypogyna]
MHIATRHSRPELSDVSSGSSEVMVTLPLPDVHRHAATTALYITVPELHGVLQESVSPSGPRWLHWKRQKVGIRDVWVDFDGYTWKWFKRTGPGVYKSTPTLVLPITPLSRIDVAVDGGSFMLFDDGKGYTFQTPDAAHWTSTLQAAMVAQAYLAQYHLGPSIGSGGSATVHSLVMHNAPTDLAVKLVRGQRSLVENEIEMLAYVNASPAMGPRLPTLHKAFDTADGATGFVLPLYAGGTLQERIKTLPPLSAATAAVREGRAKRMITALLGVLLDLHTADILHLDVKPTNILFRDAADLDDALVLIDFGMAQRASTPSQTLHDTVRGTPGYMAPELLHFSASGSSGGEDIPVSSATDVFSAGVVLYTFLLGGAPFPGSTKSEVIERMLRGQMVRPKALWDLLSSDAQDFVMSMLQRKARHRATIPSLLRHSWLTSLN